MANIKTFKGFHCTEKQNLPSGSGISKSTWFPNKEHTSLTHNVGSSTTLKSPFFCAASLQSNPAITSFPSTLLSNLWKLIPSSAWIMVHCWIVVPLLALTFTESNIFYLMKWPVEDVSNLKKKSKNRKWIFTVHVVF